MISKKKSTWILTLAIQICPVSYTCVSQHRNFYQLFEILSNFNELNTHQLHFVQS